jgi:hypothetical protein
MQQWHTPSPPLSPAEAPLVDFSRFKETDVIYPLANAMELDRLGAFIDELELNDYVPVKSYNDLKHCMGVDAPIFATHVQLYVMTAKLHELKRDGLCAQEEPQATKSLLYPHSSSFHVANEPCSFIPKYFPQLAYGIESIITPEWVRAYHRCCKLDVNHPGCWYGPVKYQVTPWVIVAPDFTSLKTRPEIINGLRVPIVKGTYWLKDPTDEITKLRSKLEGEIANAILSGTDMSIDYYTLLDLSHCEDFIVARGGEPSNLEEIPQFEPLDDFPGKVYYLEINTRRDEYAATKADIDRMVTSYQGAFISYNLEQTTALLDEFFSGTTLSEDELLTLRNSLQTIDLERLEILKRNNDAPISGDSDTLLKKAQVLGRRDEILQRLQLIARIEAVSAELGEAAVVPEVPDLEDDYINYVEANKGSIPNPLPYPLDPNVQYQVAYEYFLTGVVPMRLLEPKDAMISPYGSAAAPSRTTFSTGTQFKWDKDSCWYDSVFTGLFSIPNSPWEIEIRNATKMQVRTWCDASTIRNAIMQDIEYLQRDDPPQRPSEAIQYFEKCTLKPQRLSKYERATDTFDNLKALFQLSDSIVLRDLGDIAPDYTTFAAIVSRPGHFVVYIMQPDKQWVRMDDIADPTERVLFFDRPPSGGKRFMKNKDIPGAVYEFEETVNFYLDMKTTEWAAMTQLTPRDILRHWQNVRNRLNLLQPVYLTDAQQKKRNASSIEKSIPSHNKLIFGDFDTFATVVRSIKNGTFNYAAYPDGVGNINLPEPANYLEHLKELINAFSAIMVSSDPHDERSYYQLLMLALKPRYESIVLYDQENNVPRLVSIDKVQDYVKTDEAEMLEILNYFLGASVKGKVVEI